jgi:hypothetical protein
MNVGDADETETRLNNCGDQRTLFDRFWARHRLRYLSVLRPTPDDLLDLYASRRRGRIEMALAVVGTDGDGDVG